MLEQRRSVADFKLSRAFNIEAGHFAVLDQHRVAVAAQAHALARQVLGQSGGLGEVCAAVGQHAHLAAGFLLARPGAHNERVVHADAPYLIDTGGLELGEFFDITGDMLGRASGRERARQGKQCNGFASAGFGHIDQVGANAAAAAFDVRIFPQRGRGKGVTYFDHELLLFFRNGFVPVILTQTGNLIAFCGLSMASRRWKQKRPTE